MTWLPVVGSFVVYLIPLAGPHAVWLLGESLVQELTRAEHHDPWRLTADVGLALATQVAVWRLLAWSLESPRRWLTWIAVVPALLSGLNAAYLVAIPSYFLIEPDTAPELTRWAEHCVVPGATLMSVRTPSSQPTAGVREWWLRKSDSRYALLSLPDCVVVDAALPSAAAPAGGRVDFIFGFQFAAPGGAATVERTVPATSARTFWLLASPTSPLVPIEQPKLTEGAPILSNAADAVGWLQRVAGSGPPVLERVLIRPLRPASALPDVDIELAPLGAASYTLVGVDTSTREASLWRNDQPLVVGFDGERHDVASVAGDIRPQASTYLRHRDGWVAWDAYREEEPYRLAWSLTAGSGTHVSTKGRSITSAAVDPSGTLIAISETTALSIGSARDVVYVIRARDGADVFRRYLPRYARSVVMFFEGGLFGYSDLTGTHIRTIPR